MDKRTSSGKGQENSSIADSETKGKQETTNKPLRPCLSIHDTGSKGQQREVISVGRYVKVSDGLKWLKRAGEMTIPVRSLLALGGKAMGVFGRDKSPSCLEGMPRAILPGCIVVGS